MRKTRRATMTFTVTGTLVTLVVAALAGASAAGCAVSGALAAAGTVAGSATASASGGPAPGTMEASVAALSAVPFRSPPVARDEAVWRALEKYCPDAAAFVAWSIANGGSVTATTRTVSADGKVTETTKVSAPFFVWIDQSLPLRKQVLDGLPLAVHEENHGFAGAYPNSLFTSGAVAPAMRYVLDAKGERVWVNFEVYPLDRDTLLFAINRSAIPSDYSYRLFPAFPARDIAYLVPPEARTHRFPAYVDIPDPKSIQSTQSSGISGLLDEYNSYRWSVQVLYDLFEYVEDVEPTTVRAWHEWLEATVRVYLSWAEFRLYIAAYLLHAKEAEPVVYRSLMADGALRAAFTGVDDRFTALVSALFRRWTVELPERLAARGIPFRIYRYRDELFWDVKEPSSAPPREWLTLFNTFRLSEFSRLEAAARRPEFVVALEEFRLRPSGPLPTLDAASFGAK